MKLSTKLLLSFSAVSVVVLISTAITFAVSVEPSSVDYLEIPAHTTMQDFDSNDCSAMPFYTTIELTDTRNSQKYRISKMSDGRCWMIDNLKIANITINSTNSDVLSNYTIPPIGTKGILDDTPYVDDPALNSDYKNNCIYNMGTSPDSFTGCGYLYSWSTATAGTGNGLSTDGQNATGSICPIGWRLPTGTATGEFAILNGSMLAGNPSTASSENTDKSRANWWSTGPFSGSYAGEFHGSSWDNTGAGIWWSSTAISSTYSYRAFVQYNYLGAGTPTDLQYTGSAVRCILD